MSFNKISIIGLGYIGLPTAAAIANSGIKVLGVDVNKYVVGKVNAGLVHILEPGLGELISDVVSRGFLQASVEVGQTDAYVIAVPTPTISQMNNEVESPYIPDLKYVFQACQAVSKVLKKGDLVIIESTCPVGTTDKVVSFFREARNDLTFPAKGEKGADISIAYCPERVLPGKIIHEIVNNDRIVGGVSSECAARAKQLYQLFVKGEIHVTDAKTAELAKLSENSFRDVNIAFANELSMICDGIGVDVYDLIELVNKHPRVNVLTPGCGVGGHCIAVDPWFIVDQAPATAKLIRTARYVNDNKPEWVVEKIVSTVNHLSSMKKIEDITVACLGLTFKPDVDDLRESPALKIYKRLLNESFRTIAVEPNIPNLPEQVSNGELLPLNEALSQCDVCVVLVGHSQFNTEISKQLNSKILINFTNLKLQSVGND